jgi:hypothetical protein
MRLRHLAGNREKILSTLLTFENHEVIYLLSVEKLPREEANPSGRGICPVHIRPLLCSGPVDP